MENFRAVVIPDKTPLAPESGNGWGVLKDVLETLLISLVLFAVINFVSARIRVESVSMRETLYAGDFVYVNKLAYKFGAEPGRGDVVVFEPPVPSDEPYIKRVIGLPGDEISIQRGDVYVNGVQLSEPYTKVKSHSDGSWVVSEGAIFVMGDNRNNSSDSRAWGEVPIENVIGKAIFVYWPIQQWGALADSAVAAESP